MSELKCNFLKQSLLTYFEEATSVEDAGDSCVVTLPIPTLDQRLVDIFVEARVGDYYIVHDGGKAVNELILQGARLTDSVNEYLEKLARRFSLTFDDEMFKGIGRRPDLQSMILGVGMCSALAMAQLVGHVVASLDEPLKEQFGSALRTWARRKMHIKSDVEIKGKLAKHRFDFLASPKTGRGREIAMSVLSPGSNPLAAAQRFGFKAADLDSTDCKWQRVAVEDRAEQWSAEARNIVRSCADKVIEIPSGTSVNAQLVEKNLHDFVAAA